MSDLSSRILRVGLINSGVFDLLALNFDVPAIHLVGQNNVGKTSLISLIQFLYFHDTREMTFPKSVPESLAFYFRREGSYILFEVRTLAGLQRTVGIYGEGTADSRRIFVFDGRFNPADFLDDNDCVLPLKKAQGRLYDRKVRFYKRFEDYERALLGQHTDAAANVQMFDLNVTNYRLLRKLLQGLLRLDRLTAGDIQQFIISNVETGAVQTKIDIAQTFGQRYQEIRQLQKQLTDLRILAPVIKQWQSLQYKIDSIEQRLVNHQERFFHVSGCYKAQLEQEYYDVDRQYQRVEQESTELAQQRETLAEKRGGIKRELQALETVIAQFEDLQEQCSRYSRARLQQEYDKLINQRFELQNLLTEVQVEDAATIKIRINRLEKEIQGLVRRQQRQPVSHLWETGGFTEPERSLFRFLLSNNLIGLPESDTVTDRQAFLSACRQALTHLDPAGTFSGFGLTIPRSEWYTPEAEEDPLAEQLARVQQSLDTWRQKYQAATEREQVQVELRRLQQQIETKKNQFGYFTRLEALTEEHQSLADCRSEHDQLQQLLVRVEREISAIQQKQQDITQKSKALYARRGDLETKLDKVSREYQTLQKAETACPEDILQLDSIGLDYEYKKIPDRIRDARSDLKKAEEDISEPQNDLQARYDRESPDILFAEWIDRKLDIAAEIVRFEEQLQEAYANLIAQVQGQLNKLIEAFETIKSRVADLNRLIQKVSISNIERIELEVAESEIVEAIRQTSTLQPSLFSVGQASSVTGDAQDMIENYLDKLRNYGQEISLADMFRLQFQVWFSHSSKPVITTEIHKFESHGTETGIKIVLYLGLIRLLQGERKKLVARVPFFLDEVGSIDTDNLRQLIAYCTQNNFLPIFASPDVRADIPHSYIFRRQGNRSMLVNEYVITAADSGDNA